MTITEFWNRLDELATSKDTSNALLEMADILREAVELPLLILCRRTPGRIHHLYTVFDERNPDATGNRYPICFTGEKRRKRKTKAGTWKAMESGEIAKVPVKKVLAYMMRSKAVGGLVFNPYDEKRSMALAKFLV